MTTLRIKIVELSTWKYLFLVSLRTSVGNVEIAVDESQPFVKHVEMNGSAFHICSD